MIPLQVRMAGWMRYRDEQTADFSEGNLIAICGENGAGKSSIFDAITFALFGRHRLGQQRTEDLISEDADNLWVEFDFELAGNRFRVHRGRGRPSPGSPARATFGLKLWDDQSNVWADVPGSERSDGLSQVLGGILKLSEEAFTSSFILKQG